MNQMQAMIMQAQKIKRDLKKGFDELAVKEFEISKGGVVKVVVLGNKTIKSVTIEEEALNKDDKEMVEESIALAINEAFAKIKEAEEEINLRVTGRKEGLAM